MVLASFSSEAQTYLSYTPYSFYGIGDIPTPGTAYNKSMGGVGIASRNHQYINPLNPAAVTARDSLAFMADFSVYADNKILDQTNMRSASNTFNINDLILSFPIWKSSAMMLGIIPFSGIGYGYKASNEDPQIVSQTYGINYSAVGQGAMYQAFAAAGVTFFKKLSLGVQFNLMFGEAVREYYVTFSNSVFNGIQNGHDLQLYSPSWKFGLQYEQPIGKQSSLIFGATYRMKAKLKGEIESYKFSTGTVTDTLYYNNIEYSGKEGVSLASETGLGLCYKYSDKLMVEFDYTISDWTVSKFNTTAGLAANTEAGALVFTPAVSQAFRLGLEYTPNRNDIRYYFKKCAYRAGAYYKKEYYCVDGHPIIAKGITVGATLPIFRWYNGLTLGLEVGTRGTMDYDLIKETYFNISAGINIFDIWFQKPRYE